MDENAALKALYDESLMEEYLAKVGMRLFVQHYFELKSGKCALPEVTRASRSNRLAAANALFSQGLHLAALRRVSVSKCVSGEIAELAAALYVIETH